VTQTQPHTHGYSHSDSHSHSDAAAAALAQREATVIGWVAGVPIPRARLADRVAELRAGRLAGRLPTVGSKEDRQFLRWTAQVLLTEELCRIELARLRRDAEPRRASSPTTTHRVLTQAESLHLGSVNAAAWSACPEMAELFDLVTKETASADRPTPRRTWHRVMHSLADTPLAADAATPRPLGWTTLDDLPVPLAAELRAVPTGVRVGPIRSGLGWHVATVVATEVRADPQPGRTGTVGIDPLRLASFNRWLDERRRVLVQHAPGFEHPGDPAQPDNTHRH
jgi:[acyl-carrier-protein] S-malonyltransferase